MPLIRRAEARDGAAIRACAEAAYAQYVEVIGKRPAPMDADFEGLIAQGAVHVAVDAAGAVLGFIVFFQSGVHMDLENVAVHPSASGQGIGARLIDLCEAEARLRGAASVRLYTNQKMSANLAIYPRMGYRETERRREDGFDRVYFEKGV